MWPITEVEMILPRNRVVVSEQHSTECGVWVREIPGSQYVLATIDSPLEAVSLSFEQIKPYLEGFLLPELVAELQGVVGLNVHQYRLENEQTLIAVVVVEHIKHNLLFTPLL